MSDEIKNQSNSRSCLIAAIPLLAAVLVLLGNLCFTKVKLVLNPPPANSATQDQPDATSEAQTVMGEPYLVVIDPGHQAQGNRDKEPIGPGAEKTKAKVTSGAEGVETGQQEYELNLQVALRLQGLLEERGYQVALVRTGHDVDISNAQRAQMANELEADAFIRIHANSDEDPDTRGVMTLCQTPADPFETGMYDQSRALARCLLEETALATGAEMQPILETDTMAGINWCRVPVTIVEMGYLSNPEEDRLLLTEDYQQQLAQGMADGIDRYFAEIAEDGSYNFARR